MNAEEHKAERRTAEMTIVSLAPTRPPNPVLALKKLILPLQEERRQWQGIDPSFCGCLQGINAQAASPAQEQLQQLCQDLFRLFPDSDSRPPLLKFQAQQNKEVSARVSPLSSQELLYRLYKSEGKLVKSVLEQAGFTSTEGNDWHFLWAGAVASNDLFEGLTEHQKINHFPGSTQLTRKDQMYENIQRLQHLCGKSELDIVPETYLLPSQLQHFASRFTEAKELTWIAKPSSSSQGKGIFLVETLDQLPANESYVVSQYIASPLLVNNLKFDMRIYVVVTSYDPLRIYVYEEGLTRFASEEYTGSNRKNARFMHLTNYAVNKRNENYIQNQDYRKDNVGHKWSLSALFKYLGNLGIDTEFVWTKICDLIVKAVISVQDVVLDTGKDMGVSQKNCFDLFGFDVLLDNCMKPWLLEVNLSPSLATETSLDWFIKSNMLVDALNLVGIRGIDRRRESFKPRIRFRSKRKTVYSSVPPRSVPSSKPSSSSLTFKEVLRDTVEEYDRRGHFMRVYPSKGSNYYDKFFATPQHHTRMLYGVMFEGVKVDLGTDMPPTLSSPSSDPASASVTVLHSRPHLQFIKPKSTGISIRKLASIDKDKERGSFDKRLQSALPREKSLSAYSASTAKETHLDKIVVTGDDILMEYISRLIQELMNTSEDVLTTSNRKSIETFVTHSVWRTADPKSQGKGLLWQRLEGRYFEMRVRRMRITESEARIRGGAKENMQAEEQRKAVVAGFTAQQLEEMLRVSTRNVAREVVLPLLDHFSGGVLSNIQSALPKSVSSQFKGHDCEEEASDKSPQMSPRAKRRASLEQLSGPDVLRVSWKLAPAKKRPQSMAKSMRS